MSNPRPIAIAIPAHDEAALIGRCLDAIAAQDTPGDVTVIVLANNCTDATAKIARQPRGFKIDVIEHDLAPGERNAGAARRLAMAWAAERGDILLTTDADCVPDRDWIAAHRAAFVHGVDAVAGRVSGDWEEIRHHPAAARVIGALEWEYLGLIGEAEALFDPQPHDPAPRHAQQCGANIGITRVMLTRIGGVPPIATGEDRALLAAVQRLDGRVRHDPGPHVTASARVEGRASGGMADALAARLSSSYRCDDQFAPADLLVKRWRTRRAARSAWAQGVPAVQTPCGIITLDREAGAFGAFWESVEQRMPRPECMTPADLPAAITRLRELMADHG